MGFFSGLLLPPAATAEAPISYFINQNFEGAGYDNGETWTESGGGIIDEDYSTLPIVGSQSLRIARSAQGGASFTEFAEQTPFYAFFRFRLVSMNASDQIISTLRNSTNIRATLTITAAGVFRVLASGGINNSATDVVPVDTDIYVWFEYIAGNGSNTIARAGWSTDGTKPTIVSGGAKTCVSSIGTSTQGITRYYLGNTTAGTAEFVFDRALAATSAIGNNP